MVDEGVDLVDPGARERDLEDAVVEEPVGAHLHVLVGLAVDALAGGLLDRDPFDVHVRDAELVDPIAGLELEVRLLLGHELPGLVDDVAAHGPVDLRGVALALRDLDSEPARVLLQVEVCLHGFHQIGERPVLDGLALPSGSEHGRQALELVGILGELTQLLDVAREDAERLARGRALAAPEQLRQRVLNELRVLRCEHGRELERPGLGGEDGAALCGLVHLREPVAPGLRAEDRRQCLLFDREHLHARAGERLAGGLGDRGAEVGRDRQLEDLLELLGDALGHLRPGVAALRVDRRQVDVDLDAAADEVDLDRRVRRQTDGLEDRVADRNLDLCLLPGILVDVDREVDVFEDLRPARRRPREPVQQRGQDHPEELRLVGPVDLRRVARDPMLLEEAAVDAQHGSAVAADPLEPVRKRRRGLLRSPCRRRLRAAPSGRVWQASAPRRRCRRCAAATSRARPTSVLARGRSGRPPRGRPRV